MLLNWKCLAHIFLLLTLYSPSRTAYIDEYLQTQSLELLEPTANVYFLTVPGQAVHVV